MLDSKRMESGQEGKIFMPEDDLGVVAGVMDRGCLLASCCVLGIYVLGKSVKSSFTFSRTVSIKGPTTRFLPWKSITTR